MDGRDDDRDDDREEDDWGSIECCTDCGAWLPAASDDGWWLDEGEYLCHLCTVARGGTFDGFRGVWLHEPDVADLTTGVA